MVKLSVGICICSAFIVAISPMDTPRCREAGKHNPVKCSEGDLDTLVSVSLTGG